MTARTVISQRKIGIATGLLAATLALATGGMASSPSNEPVRMSELRIEGLAGYPAYDRFGTPVGHVISVDADHKGRTRYVRIALDDGGEVRVASFNAWLDGDAIRTGVAADLLAARREMITAP